MFDRGNYAETVYWVSFKVFDLFYYTMIPKLTVYRINGKHIRRIKISITKKNQEDNVFLALDLSLLGNWSLLQMREWN